MIALAMNHSLIHSHSEGKKKIGNSLFFFLSFPLAVRISEKENRSLASGDPRDSLTHAVAPEMMRFVMQTHEESEAARDQRNFQTGRKTGGKGRGNARVNARNTRISFCLLHQPLHPLAVHTPHADCSFNHTPVSQQQQLEMRSSLAFILWKDRETCDVWMRACVQRDIFPRFPAAIVIGVHNGESGVKSVKRRELCCCSISCPAAHHRLLLDRQRSRFRQMADLFLPSITST